MKNTEKKTRKPAAKKTAAVKKENKTIQPAEIKTKADVNPDYTDAFINEVSEEVKNDNFKELWNRYGLLIIAIVAVAV